jgi:hypothetical protein
MPHDTAARDRAYGASKHLGLLAYEVAESGRKSNKVLALSAAFMLICLTTFVGLACMALS